MKKTACALLATWSLIGCSPMIAGNAPGKAFIPGPCAVGIFGEAQRFAVITRRAGEYRYSFDDGYAGLVSEHDDIACGRDALRVDGGTVLARRPVRVTNTRFDLEGATLAGQLLEPQDADGRTALVVYAHGSEELGWIEAARDPYQMVARGVSVFVYDKRGTGQSTGSYSQNFPQLANDLVAASAEAKRLANGRYGRFGLFGLSQGGWIVPLAAKRSGAEFIGIGYGLVVDILEEDASQVALELTEAGFGADAVAKAKTLTDVTARLAVSGYTDGLEDLDTLRELYRDEPWYATVRGGFSGVILGKTTTELRTKGIPFFDRMNIDWSLDPVEVIREVEVPQLWILAGEDREAPYIKTQNRLQTLRNQGKNISIFVFPDTDHGMWEFKEAGDGKREMTRVTQGFYDLMADWARHGDTRRAYGRSQRR